MQHSARLEVRTSVSPGREAETRAWDAKLHALYDFAGVEPNPIPVKALLREAGIGEGLRLPLTRLADEHAGPLADAAAAILAIENECRRPAASP